MNLRYDMSKNEKTELRLTQPKRFVPYGTHPNFCFAKAFL